MTRRIEPLSVTELLDLPAAVDLRTACRALNISPNRGYDMVKNETFPVPVHRIGGQYRVPAAALRRYLGVEAPAA